MLYTAEKFDILPAGNFGSIENFGSNGCRL